MPPGRRVWHSHDRPSRSLRRSLHAQLELRVNLEPCRLLNRHQKQSIFRLRVVSSFDTELCRGRAGLLRGNGCLVYDLAAFRRREPFVYVTVPRDRSRSPRLVVDASFRVRPSDSKSLTSDRDGQVRCFRPGLLGHHFELHGVRDT